MSKAQAVAFGGLTLVAICFAIMAWVLYEPDPDQPGSPRISHLEALASQLNLTKDQVLIWAPSLTADTFWPGAAFIGSGYAQSFTNSCDQIHTVESTVGVRIGDGKRYAFSPELVSQANTDLDTSGAKSVEFSLNIKTSELIPGYVELITDLSKDKDCLAAIANRPVMLLFGVFRGDESLTLSREFTANLSFSAFKSLLLEKLNISGSASRNNTFNRSDATLIWVLTKIHLKDEAFPSGKDVTDAATLEAINTVRTSAAASAVEQESDYAVEANEVTDISPPTEADIQYVVQIAETVNAANRE